MTQYNIYHVKDNIKRLLYRTYDVCQAIAFCSHNTQASAALGLTDKYYFEGALLMF